MDMELGPVEISFHYQFALKQFTKEDIVGALINICVHMSFAAITAANTFTAAQIIRNPSATCILAHSSVPNDIFKAINKFIQFIKLLKILLIAFQLGKPCSI